MKTLFKKQDLILLIIFVIAGVLSRTVFHIGMNIEFVTALSLASGYFFIDKKFSFLTPLFIMLFSDLIIGNTNIYLFTWSAFLFSSFLGIIISSKSFSKLSKLIKFEWVGILSTAIFFLWTNFGVVVLTNMYVKTFDGLVQSYINGLPFLRNQLIGNIVIVPLIFIAIEFCLSYKKNLKYKTN